MCRYTAEINGVKISYQLRGGHIVARLQASRHIYGGSSNWIWTQEKNVGSHSLAYPLPNPQKGAGALDYCGAQSRPPAVLHSLR
jgi:hypothetical protein